MGMWKKHQKQDSFKCYYAQIMKVTKMSFAGIRCVGNRKLLHACPWGRIETRRDGLQYACRHGKYPISDVIYYPNGSPNATQNDIETGPVGAFLAAAFGPEYFLR